jgi:hypothetical protein
MGILISLEAHKKEIMTNMMIGGPFLFNAVIDGLDLRELKLSNRKFTWINSRKIPTYEMLD